MVSHAILHLNLEEVGNGIDGINNAINKSSTDENTLTVHCASNDTSNALPRSLILTSITIHINDIQTYDPLSLASLVSTLRKDGQGVLHLHFHTGVKDDTTTSTKAQSSMMLAGLTPESELRESNDCRIFTARLKKKNIDKGRNAGSLGRLNRRKNRSTASKAKLNLKRSTVAIVKIDIQNATRLLSSEDGKEGNFDDYNDGLIDEDDLLNFESTQVELAPPPTVDLAERSKAAYDDDCGGRKACDNCTCGRAEAEQAEVSNTVTSSACGNCSKGDAFRCAGCPYLGKPAFKEGEEHLVLDLTDDF